MKPRFFKSQADFRAWLERHGSVKKELWIGYYKRSSGKGGLVYRQALEHLDGVRDEAATRALIVQENRRYARRQLIWFRKEPNLMWFQGPGESLDTQARVFAWLAERGLLYA